MNSTPRIMIAATSSGSGKTTITCALLKALINRKINVTSFKCGPDYIDPMFHKEVIGTNSANLDLFFTDENTTKYLMCKNTVNSDISIIEGVMGYYDGIAGKSVNASSYALAKTTQTPVILVVNCKGMSVSIVAQIKGLIDYKEDSNIRGVILNNISPMLYADIKNLIENELEIKVLGYMPNMKDCLLESRHLGLVTASEIDDLKEKLEKMAAWLEKTVDIGLLVSIANSAKTIECKPITIPKLSSKSCKIAVAKDEAFCFYYQDSIDLLCEIGAEIVYFSPIKDEELPKNIDGLIIGGGYPEIYASNLEQNETMLNSIKQALENGLPCIAECGGFMYLHKHMEDSEGIKHKMVGYFDACSFKTDKLSRFGYINLIAQEDNMLCKAGESINAHEFHYWDSTDSGNTFVAAKPMRKTNWECIKTTDNVFAGYPHIHFYSNIDFAYNFLNKCLNYSSGKKEKR